MSGGGEVPASELHQRLSRHSLAVARAEEVARDARAARDQVIGEAEAAGWTLPSIAAACGLSVAQVGRIAVRESQRGQSSG